jgi:hypothetical protein
MPVVLAWARAWVSRAGAELPRPLPPVVVLVGVVPRVRGQQPPAAHPVRVAAVVPDRPDRSGDVLRLAS